MPQISFIKNYPPLLVKKGENLMKCLLKNDLPVASSCGGEGVCAKCNIQIHHGHENLSLESNFEKNLKAKHQIPDSHRISCQTYVLGNISIDTSYW